MSDATTDAIYKILSSSLRRLCGELKAAAGAYGYLGPARKTVPSFAGTGREDTSLEPWGPDQRGDDSGSNALPAARAGDGPTASLPKEFRTRLPAAISWTVSANVAAAACAAGAVSLVVGGAALLSCRTVFAGLIIGVPTLTSLALAVGWLAAWGLLELTVHRSTARVYRLLADLHAQHKITREAVR